MAWSCLFQLQPSSRVCEFVHWGLGRKARQPRGGPKGAGSDWSEATSCTFWQLPGSARLRPLCALLPALPPFLATRFNLTVFFFSLSQASFGSSSPGLFSFLTSSRGSQREIDRLKGLLLKERILYTHRNISYFFPVIWILESSNVITLLEEGIVYCSLCACFKKYLRSLIIKSFILT